jgi:hypothetical protein
MLPTQFIPDFFVAENYFMGVLGFRLCMRDAVVHYDP